MPPRLVIATTNRGKLREVRAILADLPVQMVALDEFPTFPEPVEDADTFEGNAIIKALHYAQLAGEWTLAEDSGLEVDILGGRPGVRSARYAGSAGDAAANNARLVAELVAVPPEERTARFRCVAVLANGTEVVATASGSMEGLIVDEPRGDNGFGYDPHFFVPQFGMTTAQMSTEQKNSISHRGNALAAIRPEIERLLESSDTPAGGNSRR